MSLLEQGIRSIKLLTGNLQQIVSFSNGFDKPLDGEDWQDIKDNANAIQTEVEKILALAQKEEGE